MRLTELGESPLISWLLLPLQNVFAGREQLAFTGRRLKTMNIKFDRLIHSGMTRALQSAQIINQQLKDPLPLIEDRSLMECFPVAPSPFANLSQQQVDVLG